MIGTTKPVDAGEIPEVDNEGRIVEAHYDSGRKTFWTKNSRGGWIEVNEQGVRRLLRGHGFHCKAGEGESVSEVDRKLIEVQIEKDVIYAGPLAGHHQGPMECFGNRILVTTSPKLIQPVAGDWPMIHALITNLLADGRFDQREYLFAWLKFALEALHAGRKRPGPVLALAGPRDSGKSLVQNLFTEILGGRAAKPYRYMSGRTDFNAELFGAEHLMIEDEVPSTDIRSRRSMGINIKAFCANELHSCHAKGRQALTLAPFWRVSISVNAEPEDLMVLPPMSDSEQDSIGDKIILLRAKKADMPMPSERLEERELFRKTLTSELPAFVHFLKVQQVSEEVRHPRYGVRAWQHPELLAALEALAPEIRLLSLIDEVFFPEPKNIGTYSAVKQMDFWEGTADAMERLLRETHGGEMQRLLTWSGAAGTYLGRLAHSRPQRVRDARKGDSRNWLLLRSGPLASARAA